jgi:hypothetical protein
MLFRKVVGAILLAFLTLAGPVALQHITSDKTPVMQADGGAPEPPPLPWATVTA